MHVRENRAAIEGAAVLESDEVARETIARNLQLVADRGVSATGEVVSSFGDHDDAAERLLAEAREDAATDEAPCDVLIVRN